MESSDEAEPVKPRLQAAAGPLTDSTYFLTDAEVRIGRDPSNGLAISDLSLSRRHCLLSREQDKFKICDLDSRNGTFVNGSAISEYHLTHGDQISVGESVFVFLEKDDEDPEQKMAAPVEFDDSITQATTQIRPQDVIYLQPDRVLKELPVTSRLGRNLNALLKISRIVHSISDLNQLQGQILKLIFEVVPAERGAILLDGTGNEKFSSLFVHPAPSKRGDPVRVSRTITRQVMEQGVAILGADVPGSGGLSTVESLASFQVRSLLCVPLTVFQQVVGCVYLDTTNPVTRFDRDHLELVASIAGISAVASGEFAAVAVAGTGKSSARGGNKSSAQHGWRKQSHEGGLPISFARSSDGCHRAGGWGERYGERIGGQGNSSQQSTGEPAVCRHQLCRDSGRPSGK